MARKSRCTRPPSAAWGRRPVHEAPHTGNPHREPPYEDLRHQEDETLRRNFLDDLREGVGEDLPVEERLLDERPAPRVHHGDRDEGQEDDRADDGDRDAAPPSLAQRLEDPDPRGYRRRRDRPPGSGCYSSGAPRRPPRRASSDRAFVLSASHTPVRSRRGAIGLHLLEPAVDAFDERAFRFRRPSRSTPRLPRLELPDHDALGDLQPP